MGKASRLARRQGFGRPVRTYRQAFPLWFHLLFVAMIVIIVGATAVNQNLGIGTKVWGASIPLVLLVVVWWLLCDVRLVLCEAGLIVGRFFPGMSPYVIPYRALEPRGMTCVSNVGRLSAVTGRSYGSTLFYLPQSGRGLVFDGPLPAQARSRSSVVAHGFDTSADTVRGGKLWAFAYRGRPEELIATLQQGLVAQQVPHAEQLAQVALPERGTGANRAEARSRINGFAH